MDVLQNEPILYFDMDGIWNSSRKEKLEYHLINSYEEDVKSRSSSIILTVIVLLVGLIANFTFLWFLLAVTDKRSRLRPFLINLALADLLVCCFTIAMELGWRLTTVWIAGDFACRLLSVTKTLGLYLEALVVLAMSIDRCYVVLWPLRVCHQAERTRMLLIGAWTSAVLFSFPQAVVYHVEAHDLAPTFTQCISFNSFGSPTGQKAYVLFGIISMYFLPLTLILTISGILLFALRAGLTDQKMPNGNSIFRSCRETSSTCAIPGSPNISFSARESQDPSDFASEVSQLKPLRTRLPTGLQLCHSNIVIRKRARTRTLKLSMLILLAFLLCYTPYAIMIWVAYQVYETDQGSVPRSSSVYYQYDILLMLSLSFSTIMNPVVYGSYIAYSRKTLARTPTPFSHSFH